MAPRGGEHKAGRVGRSFAGGFVRIGQRRRGRRNRLVTVAIMILIALVFAGTIIRRTRLMESPRYLSGHSREYRYRQVAPDENLAPDDDRRLDQTIRERSRR